MIICFIHHWVYFLSHGSLQTHKSSYTAVKDNLKIMHCWTALCNFKHFINIKGFHMIKFNCPSLLLSIVYLIIDRLVLFLYMFTDFHLSLDNFFQTLNSICDHVVLIIFTINSKVNLSVQTVISIVSVSVDSIIWVGFCHNWLDFTSHKT